MTPQLSGGALTSTLPAKDPHRAADLLVARDTFAPPASISPMAAVRTGTPLVNPECRAMRQHVLIWYGVGLCCITDYSRDPVHAPRPGTVRATQPSADLEEPTS